MIERSASLPTRFMSSPCPAIPTTRVLKISGTISDLIIRRNTFDSTLRSVPAKCQPGPVPLALSGKAQPISRPTTIEIRIHCVSEMRRTVLMGTAGEASLRDLRRRVERHRRAPAAEGGVPVAVREVQDEPEEH